MPTSKDEFEPPRELIESLLDSEVLPRFASFEDEGCAKLSAQIFVVVHDFKTSIGAYCSSGATQGKPNGELQIRTRKTGIETRVVWRIESLFPALEPATGFVGFDSRGDAQLFNGQWTVRSSGWTGKYNVVAWRGWK